MITATEAIEKAKSVRRRVRGVFASDYSKSIEILYDEKGLTFQEISDFFRKIRNFLGFLLGRISKAF